MKTRDLLQQGCEEGIKALVVTLKELSYTPELVAQKVAERFDLSSEKAVDRTKQYWEQ